MTNKIFKEQISKRSIFIFIVIVMGFLFIMTETAEAANLYWVGGNGDNVGDDNADWNTTDPAGCTDGAGDGTVPGVGDVAIFDLDCDNGAAINANWSVLGIDIQNGYAGTIVQNADKTLTIGSSNYTQADGTFTGGNSTIDINGNFTISGGNFTSTSGTMEVAGHFIETNSPPFNANGGTITFDGSASLKQINAPNIITFNLVTIEKSSALVGFTIAVNTTIPLGNTPSSTGSIVNYGKITAGSAAGGETWTHNGNITNYSEINTQLEAFDFSGSYNNSGAGSSLFMSANPTFNIGASFLVTSGSTFPSNSTLTIDGTGGTINASGVTFTLVTISSSTSMTISAGTTVPLGNTPISTGSIANYGTITAGSAAGGETWTQNGNIVNYSGGIINTQLEAIDINGAGVIGSYINYTGSELIMSANPTLNIALGLTVEDPDPTKFPTGSNVIFDGGAISTDLDADGVTFNSLTIGLIVVNTLTIPVAATITVTGTTTLNNGKLDGGTLESQGDINVGAGWDGGDADYTVNGGVAQTINGTGTSFTSGTVTIDNSGATASLGAATTITTLTIDTNGTLDLDGNDLTSTTFTLNGTLQLQGGENCSTPDTIATGSTVIYNSAGVGRTLKNWAYDNLRLASAVPTTYDLPDNLILTANLTIDADNTLDATGNDYNLTVAGNWSNSGTLTAQEGTVTFNDSAKTSIISGNTTFYSFVCSTPSKRIDFTDGTTQTITNNLNLNGQAAGTRLDLNSTNPGTQWNIDTTGATVTADYLNVQDSNSTVMIGATNSTDSGNNINWFPAAAEEPTLPIREGFSRKLRKPGPTLENPKGGFKIVINAKKIETGELISSEYTEDRKVTLVLFAGDNVKWMSISDSPQHKKKSERIPYQPFYIYDLCQGKDECSEKTYTIYVRFYTKIGQASPVVSEQIIYREPLKPANDFFKQEVLEIEIPPSFFGGSPIKEKEEIPDRPSAEEQEISETGITPPSGREIKTILSFGEEIVNVIKIVGKKAVKVAVPAVIITGVTVGIAQSILITTQIKSFYDLYLFFLKLLGILSGFLGIRKRYRPWGTVYDSVTKRPLDPAYVVIKKGKEKIAANITDLNGRYGFFLPAGNYTITVNKSHYKFPSEILKSKSQDKIYRNLYHGGSFTVIEGEVINRDIPLDSVSSDWNEFVKNKKKFFMLYSKRELLRNRIFNTIYIIGFLTSLLTVIFSPNIFSIFVFLFYIGITFFQKLWKFKYRVIAVKDMRTGDPIPFAIIRAFVPNLNYQVKSVVADELGRFYFLIFPGRYYFTVEEKQDDGSYKKVYQSESREFKKGIFDKDIIINKN